MRGLRFFKTIIAGTVLISLAACTNSRQDVNVLNFSKTLFDGIRAQGKEPVPTDPQLVQQVVSRGLTETDGPLALISFDKTKSVSLLRSIETNGPYRTWAAFGSSERRSITTREGVVTATRGLGFDMMSSSVNDLLRMVKTQEDGIARQVIRHLDGENIISETETYCAFTPGGAEAYDKGELQRETTRVDVFCKTETGSFNNHYLVDASGRIVEARQWLGPDLGFGTLQQLR